MCKSRKASVWKHQQTHFKEMGENWNQAISAYQNVTTFKRSFKRENTFLWKETTFIFTHIPWIWSPNQRLMEYFNLKVKPLASRPGWNVNHRALLDYNFAKEMVMLLDCFNDLKSWALIDLEFTLLQFGPTCQRDRKSMDSLVLCNLGLLYPGEAQKH